MAPDAPSGRIYLRDGKQRRLNEYMVQVAVGGDGTLYGLTSKRRVVIYRDDAWHEVEPTLILFE